MAGTSPAHVRTMSGSVPLSLSAADGGYGNDAQRRGVLRFGFYGEPCDSALEQKYSLSADVRFIHA